MVKIYKQPFAHDGDTIAIPDASQPDGKMSSADGWTPDYQLPKTDPNYKPVGRQEMNGVFKEVTEALGQLQQFGFADWQSIAGGWPIGANVRHAGGYWQSLDNANTEEPGTGVLWKELLFGNLVPASESIQGLIQLATTGEAQALLNDAKAMTPAKLAAAFGGGNQLLTASGYQKLPSGLIIQWGVISAIFAGSTPVSFPITFPTACRSVVPCVGYSGSGSGSLAKASVGSITASGFNLGSTAAFISLWVAIGY